MHHFKQASNIRRSGRLAGAAGGAHSEDRGFVNASQTRRKAAYPNSYAVSEGASVVQDEAHAEFGGVVLARAQYAELDGEALARAIDDEVEEEVAASLLDSPLSVAADAQVQAIQSLQAVHDSFRELSSSTSPASGDQSQQPSDASSSDKSAPSAPHSPEVSKKLQELQSQIEDLERQHAATKEKLREAEADARQRARANLATSIGTKTINALPPLSNLKRWLTAIPRQEHLAALQRDTRLDGSPLRQRVALSATPAVRANGPMDKFVRSLAASQAAAEQDSRFNALRLRQAASRTTASSSSLEQKNRRFYSKSERRAIATADDVGAERASQESHHDVDENGYEDDGFLAPDGEDDPIFSSDEESTDDNSCTTWDDDVLSDEDEDEAALRMDIVNSLFRECKRKALPGPPFPLSKSGDALAALREDDVVVKRPTSRSHVIETILSNWLRSNLNALRLAQAAEFLRQLRMLQNEFALSVYYALAKRILPICRPFYKYLFYCIQAYLPDQVPLFGRAHRRHREKKQKQKDKKSSKPVTRAPTIKDINDIADATGRFFDEYRHYARDHKDYEHKTIFECLTASQATSFASQARRSEEALNTLEMNAFMDVWRGTFGLRTSAASLAALRRVPFVGDISLPATWSTYHQSFVKVLSHAPSTKRPPPATVAEVFMENCRNSFIEDDVLAYEPVDHDEALQFVLDRLNDSSFVTSDSFRNPRPHRDGDRRQSSFAGSNAPPSRPRDNFRPRDDGHAPRDNRDNRPREADRPRQSETTPRDRPNLASRQASAPSAICTRCHRSGHSEDSCICKHDKDGNRLPDQEASIYAKRKQAAVALATQKIHAVHAIHDIRESTGSDTSDVDELARDLDESNVDGGYAIFCSTDDDSLDFAFDSVDNVVTGVHAIHCLTSDDDDASSTSSTSGNVSTGALVISTDASAVNSGVHIEHPLEFEFSFPVAVVQVADVDVPAPSLPDCGDVARQPGPTHRDDLHGYFNTPTTLPKTHAAAAPWPIVAAMPALASDSDTSDDERPPLQLSASRRKPHLNAKPQPRVVPPGMPALLTDSSSSDSDEVQGYRSYAYASRTPPTQANAPRDQQAQRAGSMPPMVAHSQEVQSDIASTSPQTSGIREVPSDMSASTSTMPALVTDSSDADDNVRPLRADISRTQRHGDDDVHIAAFLAAIDSSNSDTSDAEAEARAAFHSVCSARPVDTLLPPPRFIAFVSPPSAMCPPPAEHAVVCAIDTMCQGSHSIISETLAKAHKLPLRPFVKTCRTANGALVKCSHVAEFNLTIRICDAWTTFTVKALVWKDAAEPLLIHNKFALESGLTDFCAPNEVRCGMFGRTAFTLDWQYDIDVSEARALAIYHENFMGEEFDDLVDLSAPLRCGDQDISTLPPDAMEYAKRFPAMTRAIPRDAHPGLEKWRANIRESAIPLYSWPAAELKDLKEDRLPFKAIPKLHAEFDKLCSMHYAENLTSCPTVVAMRAQLVQKTKTEVRFCVNGSQQKKVMEVATYPMPHIRNILDFVAGFPFRAKIDMKHGYHNFEVHPDDRRWTTTIGGGRAIAWRKLVQGFASSGAFFQYAVCKLLGDRVWRICAVYLDDIIVVGNNEAECAANVADIMKVFNSYRFRINFAKCAFTPSPDIDFLGCSLRGTVCHPGPKVSVMLSKIRPPHEQLTPKGQRHHLHVFLGCCAFVMQHCPGLKQVLTPLYLAVASDPYTYGERERLAFEAAMLKLSALQPFHLPSIDPSYVVEVFTDASGGTGPLDPGAWAVALGQRSGKFDVSDLCKGFELLQLDGGVFNAKQAEWNILKKEAKALFQAMTRFRPFVFGRRVRIFVDSKVLLHMHRTECPVIRRWYAYIQQFDYEIHHISSESNSLVDCLSRCVVAPVAAPSTTPRLLKTAKLVPAPPITLGGDVQIQPGPTSNCFFVSSSSCPDVVPAPSLMLSGDVESNPGPPKTDDMPALGSDSDSDPELPSPCDRPYGGHRKSVITVDSTSPPLVAPVQPSRRTAARVDSTPPLAGRQLFDEEIEQDDAALPQHADLERDNAAPDVRFSESPPAPLPYDVKLLRMEAAEGPFAFVDSFAEALRREQDRCPHPRGLSIPFDTLDIRAQVMWFLQSSARVPMSLLYGRSFQQAFAAEPQPLSFHTREDTHVPATWPEYCNLMADTDTMPDLLFMRAACITYGVQLIMITETQRMMHISPGNAFRRIFLFVRDRVHWNWGVVLSEIEAEVHGAAAIPFRFAAPALHDNAAACSRPSLSNTLDISEDKLQHIHAAHNAYSGHPGVQATVRLLIARGHKWRRMTAHVAQFIKRCPTCTSSRIHLHHAPPSAGSIRLHARPLSRWHIDQTGSMGSCAFTGFTIMIAFVCEVTQFTVLFGSRHGTALETAIALITLMGWLGLPESIHSDGGSENDNYVWHQVQHITGLKHTLSQPGVPTSDSIAERNIQTAKRFVRMLTVDLDKHNAWGLLLPIAQKGVNDLPREQLLWNSPNDIVFASLAEPSKFVIPTFYSRPLNGADLADVNSYHISANFAHRASCFQQLVCNMVHELQERALTASALRNPTACTDILEGQCVLIDWNGGTPPTPAHPRKRGPYKVVAVHHNSLSLEHLAFPPPADQDRLVQWSKHAHVYHYDDDVAPARVHYDPAASQVPAGIQTRNIDCVLSHDPILDRRFDPALPRTHVSRQQYSCRLYVAESGRLPPRTAHIHVFSYDAIAHTHAFDVYYQGQRELTGHTPTAFMPDNWSPHAVPPSLRPAHPAAPPHEHSFGVNDDEAQYSQ